MPNPLFQMFGNRPNWSGFPPLNMIQQLFNQFRNTFQGDPHQQVMNLLNSGQMSQEQFNQLSTMAQQFQQLINRRY